MPRPQQTSSPRRGARRLLAAALGLGTGLAMLGPTSVAADEAASGPPALTLVTLAGPGTSGTVGGVGTPADRAELLTQQDRLLDRIGSDEQPVYRWTTALNGFAAHLTPDQRDRLERDADVALVETSTIRPLAGRSVAMQRPAAAVPRLRGGAGVVVGVIDSGIAPDSPVFAEVPGLGAAPRGFAGTCQPGADWTPDTCNRKVLGARWFVAGFGADRVRTSESLSARDTLGHGTQVASIAAGNAGVTARIDRRDVGQFGGVAPQARISSYKACWAAPDPADDGCSTADLVTAVDRAVGDGVDVLNLSVAGGSGVDTLQHALLGAAEDDIVVVGAAGNSARTSYAAHATPWVTTVGAVAGLLPRATVRLGADGPLLEGTGRPSPVSGRVVLGSVAAARGASRSDARQCRPGSLDARATAGRVVVCERGGIGRIDKSRAVSQADGVGMVLTNRGPGSVSADYHSVPTVHLRHRQAVELKRWLRTHRGEVHLERATDSDPARRVAPWSAPGDPRGTVLKPDVVAPGDGVLAALPVSTGRSWSTLTGTSVAAARTSGMAALLRSRRDWSATVVRSALTTTATPLTGSPVLEQGAGHLADDLPRTHLALDVAPARWRRALEERNLDRLNLTSVVLPAGRRQFTRRVTNTGERAEYFSVTTEGFRSRVRVRPLAVRLAPGASATFRFTVTGSRSPRRLDDGHVVWRGARGGVTRLPVALTR